MQKIEKVFNKTIKSNLIHEAILYVENTNGDFSYRKGYREKNRLMTLTNNLYFNLSDLQIRICRQVKMILFLIVIIKIKVYTVRSLL